MRNVSSIPTVALTDANVSLNQPARTTPPLSASHHSGCGVRAAATTECASTSAPATTTTTIYTLSACDDAGRALRWSMTVRYCGSGDVIDVPHMIAVPSVVYDVPHMIACPCGLRRVVPHMIACSSVQPAYCP